MSPLQRMQISTDVDQHGPLMTDPSFLESEPLRVIRQLV